MSSCVVGTGNSKLNIKSLPQVTHNLREKKNRNNTNVECTKCYGTDVLEVLWEHREMGFAWVNFWNRKLQGTTECF